MCSSDLSWVIGEASTGSAATPGATKGQSTSSVAINSTFVFMVTITAPRMRFVVVQLALERASGIHTAWQLAARRLLGHALETHPDAVVYSRALPFASIDAVADVRRERTFRWIVNVNDPLPADVWPGLYRVDEWTARQTDKAMQRALPMIDAFTFPCAQLRSLEVERFPDISRVPSRLLPHIGERVTARQKARRADRQGPLRIAFSGTLRRNRARQEFTAGLHEFARTEPLAAAGIELSFHLRRPNAFGQELIGGVPFRSRLAIGESDEEVERALLEADLLLDLESEPDRPLLLTKVANGVGLRKPIWAICEPNGTTWNLVKEHEWGYATALGDRELVTGSLREIWADWKTGSMAARGPNPDLVERFSAARQVIDLAELCAEVLEPGRATSRPVCDWP